MEPAITVERLGVRFPGRGLFGRPVTALDGVDLDVRSGEIFGVLGPNGSGKTTLFRVLAGELAPNAGGRARVLGHDPSDAKLRGRVGFQPEAPPPFPYLSAGEHLDYVGALLGQPASAARARRDELLEQFGLTHAGRRPARDFSTGMAKRLSLAIAMFATPEVLLLDEPTSGLDPEGSRAVIELMRTIAGAGGTVLLASHHLQEVEECCDRVCLLHEGRKHAEGTLDALLAEDDVAQLTELHAAGLDDEARQELARAAGDRGARDVRWHTPERRRHLFELFRRLRSDAR